jgi:hypothetical protein
MLLKYSISLRQDLLEAVQLYNLARVREILTTGLSLDSAPQPLPPMTPPLIEAVCGGHRDLVEMLVDRKANLLARDVALGEVHASMVDM